MNKIIQHNQPRRIRAGFSMLELIVTMTLLAVLTAAVVPLYASALPSIQIRNAQNEFITFLYLVQEMAVRESREYRLYFNEDDGTYWAMYKVYLSPKDPDWDPDEAQLEPAHGRLAEKRQLPRYLRISEAAAHRDKSQDGEYIACYPQGTCDQVKVTFQDERTKKKVFRIETIGPLGRVKVKKWEDE